MRKLIASFIIALTLASTVSARVRLPHPRIKKPKKPKKHKWL